jgi:HSP20 family protein
VDDYATKERTMAAQQVPIKLYRSDRRLTVAAPMPGMEPQDIKIDMNSAGQLTLRSGGRGVFKGEHEVLMDEWNAGAYFRSIPLGTAVDATAADASYENGVLVVSLPLSDAFHAGSVVLERMGPTDGKHRRA